MPRELLQINVVSTQQTVHRFSTFLQDIFSFSCRAGLAAVGCLSLRGCNVTSVDSPLFLFTQGPRFPQEVCLNVMARCPCLACRTFLVCLWRSATQVLTCNTTAVQFVSGRRGRCSPSVCRSIRRHCSPGSRTAPALCLPGATAPRQVLPADGLWTSGLSKTPSCRTSFASEKSQE